MPPDAKNAGPGFIHRKPLLTAFAVQAVLTVLTFVFFRPHFTTNDDPAMRMVVQGVGTVFSPDAHFAFSHILLGWMLKALYGAFPSVSWYAGFHLSCLFLAGWAILSKALWVDSSRGKILLFILVNAYAGLASYLQINFTATAVTVFLAGILLLVPVSEDEATPGGFIGLGVVCLAASLLARPFAFFFAALAALPFLISWFGLKRFRRRTRTLALAVFTVAAVATGVDWAAYEWSPRWNEFARLNRVLLGLQLRDAGVFGRPETILPLLDSIGWTINDLKLYTAWYFLDGEIYTPTALEKLRQSLPLFGFGGKAETFRSPGALLAQPYLRDLAFLTLALLLGCSAGAARKIIFQTI